MTKIKIAVIGSRETDIDIMKLMYKSLFETVQLKHNEMLLTSGGCDLGPDTVAIKLSNYINCEIYLPDAKKMYLEKYFPKANFFVHRTNSTYREIVDTLHPNPAALNNFMYLLHGRNVDIIDRLDKGRVNCVYYAAKVDKKGNIKGGTAMACNYAKSVGVPVFNATTENDKFIEFVNNFV